MRAIGKPVALDASADERDTRGFISMTSISPSRGIHRELDVAAAGVDADLANDRDRRVAHRLVLAIGERHRRRDGDRVAGVHAHRIEVLDRADDHDVVVVIAHHLELELLPADDAALDEHLARRRQVEPAAHDLLELVAVVGDAAAGAAERERRADDRREAGTLERSPSPRRSVVGDAALRDARARCAAIASPNSLRSSAIAIARASAPISSTPYFSSTPLSASAIATLSAVWPPIVGRSASGCSRSMISSTNSGVTGSM